VRFQVEVYDRPANMIDFIAMRAIGDWLQDHTWSHVVERVLELSGGSAPEGVQSDTESLDEQEAAAIDRWVRDLVMRRRRAEFAEGR
jgi:hypothetical protein